jgi:hypothetical protein
MRFFIFTITLLMVFLFVSCSDGSGNVDDEAKAECGNDVVEEGEVCDGNKKACSEVDSSFSSGEASCNSTCDGWDKSECVAGGKAECGNEIIEEGEICDGNEKDCVEIDDVKYSGGKAACNDGCDGWIEDNCELAALCGNGNLDGDEVCDGGAIDCSALGEGYTSGIATCVDTCDAWDTSNCLPKCGNEIIEEGEECEVGDTVDCHEYSWLEYRSGEATCNPETCKWDMGTCDPTFDVPAYGSISQMVVNTVNGVTDSKKLCVPKGGEEEGCDFDATYSLNRLDDTPLNISGSYANNSKIILTSPNPFDITKGKKQACLAVNKGFDPLPEKFFTLFASIAYTQVTFKNIEMFGPQVVLMFKSDEINPGFYNITPFGEDGIIVAVGEQFDKTGDLDIDSLCIAAIGFGKKMDVKTAINVMQDGGGGTIHYEGYDIPLYHPEETPIGDVTDLIFEYGLEHVCPK